MASSVTTMTDVVVQRRHARYHWPAVQLNFWIIIMLVASATNLGIFASFLTVQSQLRVGVPWYAALSILHSPISNLQSPPLGQRIVEPQANTRRRRYFSYWISVGALSLLFIIILLWLISQRQLLPGIVIMGSFILFVLWTVGLIVISVQLWGPSGSVNSNCELYVSGQASTGPSIATLAWLQQRSICMYTSSHSTVFVFTCDYRLNQSTKANMATGQSWTAAWAFQLVGTVFLLWMMIMAYQVYREI